MNRTKLKNYAPQARRDFIQAITDRAAYYGLAANKIEPITENGDVAIIAGIAHPRPVAAKRRALEEHLKRQSFAAVIEAMAYTWFNRLVAIRFMELHGYLDHGYLVLSHPEGKDTPEILEHAEHVDMPGLDRNKVIELKLDGTKEVELYRMLLVVQCNALHAAMPFLFEKIDDETELLLPDNLLHSNSLIRKLTGEIDEQDWQQVEIIGWLYQFYISEKKDEVIGKVVKSEDIPAATQLFTPNWIVKYMVQNSLGRMWLQTYPDSGLRAKMDYYIEPAEQTEEVRAQLAAITPASIDPEAITILDPACGSGHILVEAYDLLKEIYLERGYRLRDIPKLILANNLSGLDIDDRAAQLAGFALLMKARADDRRIFDSLGDAPLVNVFAIQESAALDAVEMADALLNVKSEPRPVPIVGGHMLFDDVSAQPALVMTEGQGTAAAAKAKETVSREDVIELVELFRQGKTLGSLISVPDELAAKLPAIARAVNENLQSGDLYAREAASTLLPFVQQAELLAHKYDCVIANPPYMGGKGMNTALKAFASKHFPLSKTDLFALFIERGFDLAKTIGFNAMVTMQSWMFLSSFEAMREDLLLKHTILALIQLPYDGRGPTAMGINFGICTFICRMAKLKSYKADFSCARYYELSEDGIPFEFPVRNERLCKANIDDFKRIPGSPIAYWVSNRVRDIFSEYVLLKEIASPRQGLSTTNNNKFIRFWAEINHQKIGFNCEDREDAHKSCKKWFPIDKGGEFRKWYGNNDSVVNWEDDGYEIKKTIIEKYPYLNNNPDFVAKNPSYYFKPGVTWGKITSAIFSTRITKSGFIFSDAGMKVICDDFNQSLSISAFLNSKLVPYFLSALSSTFNYEQGSISLLPFEQPEQFSSRMTTEIYYTAKNDWDSFETSWDFQISPLLREDLKAATVEDSVNNWQSLCAANIKRIQELETENNRLFIEAYGLQDELTPEVPEDQITLARADREADIKRLVSYAIGCMMGRYSLDRAGLVYAHSGNKDFDASQYETFPADPDGIVPVMESDWFADDAAHRFLEFISTAWPKEHIEANLRFIAESLTANRNEQPRETIRRYFAAGFFKDHLKTYKKRPIYWLFSSGKQRAFQALVYLHRYNEGTLSRMRTEYVIPLQGKISSRIDHLASDIETATSTSHRRKLEKERESLIKQQDELRAYDEKLRHYADKRVALDLDDGVKVNYGKFGDLLAEVKAVTGSSED